MSEVLQQALARVAAALGADGAEFVLERPKDSGPRRSGDQPRHGPGAGPEGAAAGGGGAGAGIPRLATRGDRADRDRGARLHQLLARDRRAGILSPRHHRGGPRLRTPRFRSRGAGQCRIRLRQPDRARCTSATAAAPPWATASPRCSSGPGTRSPASSTSTTPASRSTELVQSALGARAGGGRAPVRHSGGRLPRRVSPGERRARCSSRRAARSPTCPRTRAMPRASRALALVIAARGAGPRPAPTLRRPVRRDVLGAGALRSTAQVAATASRCSPRGA